MEKPKNDNKRKRSFRNHNKFKKKLRESAKDKEDFY